MLRQSAPSYRQRYVVVFVCAIEFVRPDDSICFDLADLEHPLISRNDVFLLGFATPSSFFRAIKCWAGHTPESFRRGARGAAMAGVR